MKGGQVRSGVRSCFVVRGRGCDVQSGGREGERERRIETEAGVRVREGMRRCGRTCRVVTSTNVKERKGKERKGKERKERGQERPTANMAKRSPCRQTLPYRRIYSLPLLLPLPFSSSESIEKTPIIPHHKGKMRYY